MEQTGHAMNGGNQMFLYPRSRQFPFDSTCSQIVSELEKRNWQVPGIDVKFRTFDGYTWVSDVKSHDFQLRFCRIQGALSTALNDVAGVSRIVIPQKELCVYRDESGPNLYLYIGNDYERDREEFMDERKFNSRLDGKPRTYLVYKGQCHCNGPTKDWGFWIAHTHEGRRPPLLIHDNDTGQEYDPEGDEPKSFRTDDVMTEFVQYLRDIVLAMIVSHPIHAEKEKKE